MTYETGEAQGVVSKSFAPAAPVDESDMVVATATDAVGNTSEFSPAVEVVSACMTYDMNCGGFVSIIGDVPPFVDCVYFGDCCCGEACVCDCLCAGDCNCDGFLSIIGDVPCFVDCVYFNNCVECLAADGGDGLTIGGAVYEDEVDPLFSGITNVIVRVLDSNAKVVGETTTDPFGLWRVGGLRKGKHLVIFGAADGEGNRVKIDVNEENEAANQSIRLRRSSGVSKGRPGSVPRMRSATALSCVAYRS